MPWTAQVYSALVSVRRRQNPVRVDSSPAIASGRVFVGSNDGRVYGLDLASGKKVWEYEAASPVTSCPGRRQGQGRRRHGRRPGHLLRITPNANR